ncbi:hypothetical protein K466DRAFT_502170, partial [Polyporus arcularius HHB13444]
FSWNDERGVIMADDNVWDTFIKSHPRSKKWSKQFPLYNRIGNLLNGLQAQGKGTVHVGQVSASPKPHEDNTSSLACTPMRGRSVSPALNNSSIGSPAPRKHNARSPSSSPVPVSTLAKRSRVTGPAAMNNMVDALLHMAKSLNGRDAALATPTRRARAVKTVSADKSLLQGDRVKAIQLFTTDIAVCDSYMATDDKEIHDDFLTAILDSDEVFPSFSI